MRTSSRHWRDPGASTPPAREVSIASLEEPVRGGLSAWRPRRGAAGLDDRPGRPRRCSPRPVPGLQRLGSTPSSVNAQPDASCRRARPPSPPGGPSKASSQRRPRAAAEPSPRSRWRGGGRRRTRVRCGGTSGGATRYPLRTCRAATCRRRRGYGRGAFDCVALNADPSDGRVPGRRGERGGGQVHEPVRPQGRGLCRPTPVGGRAHGRSGAAGAGPLIAPAVAGGDRPGSAPGRGRAASRGPWRCRPATRARARRSTVSGVRTGPGLLYAEDEGGVVTNWPVEAIGFGS